VDWGDGLGVARCNCPLTESEQQFQWVTNITKIHGNHQFKFGGDFRYAHESACAKRCRAHRRLHLRLPHHLGGPTEVSEALTGPPSCSATLPKSVAMSARALNAAERQHRMFYYGQDTWRMTPKLT
jgi:hypothetical protein